MDESALAEVLLLLAATVVVVAGVRRLRLPPIIGFLAVGMLLGPHALGWVEDTEATRTLAEFGVVFLLFTLGLEFSLPRMLAMRSEVFGLGSLQVVSVTVAVGALAWLLGIPPLVAVIVGGAVAMSSTAIVVQQLTERAELNRTHGRLAFGILLFQDLAFVPFLALAATLTGETELTDPRALLVALAKAAVALLIVLFAGRKLFRPLFHEIAASRSGELFTLAVLLVAMGSAWATHAVGLSLALGAFLAGMLLAETEYRHQVESDIRPFRDILLGLFFVTVGMQLDIGLLARDAPLVIAMLAGLVALKVLLAALAARRYAGNWFKAVRTAVIVGAGGEFGFALLTLLLKNRLMDTGIVQPLLAALVLSMVLSPLMIRNNKRITRWLLRENGPDHTALAREAAATLDIARREHVILCGYGRVGQNIARVLESQGFEFIAMDLDPQRVRVARQAGEPVIFGDSADPALLNAAGIAHARAVIITFADPQRSLPIITQVRKTRDEVPILVRTQDDSRLDSLLKAGATEVVPETFEASLMLVSQVLLHLDVPVSRVVKTVGDIRNQRYSLLRDVFREPDATTLDDPHAFREERRSIVVPPGAWSVGKTLAEVRSRGAAVTFSAIRRQGIVGRDPEITTRLREGDIVIINGTPDALERAEGVLLSG